MFDSTSLRRAMVAAMAALLTAGFERASAYLTEGPQMEFVRIPAGTFYMGTERGTGDYEWPVHEVRITKPFYMGKYEVTQAQWEAVMGTTVGQQRSKTTIRWPMRGEGPVPWSLKGVGPEHPMYYVSWEDAVEFCKRLGPGFRLPTEAEWEYACRAGSQTRFHYGDDPDYSKFDQYAWYYGRSDNKTHPVGRKKPNAWGLYDMYGNVHEWCSDRCIYGNQLENGVRVDPKGPGPVSSKYSYPIHFRRVFRGGSWLAEPDKCRSASRAGIHEGDRSDLGGFRVVYEDRAGGGEDVLEIALPQTDSAVAGDPDNNSESWPRTIPGVVRDEAGQPTDKIYPQVAPMVGCLLRKYAEGRFEVSLLPSDANARRQRYHVTAQNNWRNLAIGVEIEEDTNALDIRLEPGVTLTGKVVGSDGKGVRGARVSISRLETSDWSGVYSRWVTAGAQLCFFCWSSLFFSLF